MPGGPATTISVTLRSVPSRSLYLRVAMRPSTIAGSPLRSMVSTVPTDAP